MDPKERREHILHHAALLFGDKGYHETSIADIIEAAGIARGTFYLYFENKRAIFSELVDDLLRRIKARIRLVDVSEGAPSPREQLLANLVGVIMLLTENRALLAILLEGAVGLEKEFADRLAAFYVEATATVQSSLDVGQEMGLVRPCDTRVAALATVGALKEILHDMLRRQSAAEDISKLASEFLDVLSRGVLAEGVSIP